MKKAEVDFELGMMGFAKSPGRDFLSAACLLYAGGMHEMQAITAKISEVTGMKPNRIYSNIRTELNKAWKNQNRSPRQMYDTRVSRVCPPVKKFIRFFVEQRMGEKK